MDRGALGAVLRFCRVAGVAPFQRGDEYRVSSPLVISAKLFITITAMYSIITTAASYLSNHNFGVTMALEMLWLTSILSAVVVAFVSVFTSSDRMLQLVQFLKELDKLDKQILGHDSQNINEGKLTILILIYVHVSLMIRSYDFYLNTQSYNITKNDSNIICDLKETFIGCLNLGTIHFFTTDMRINLVNVISLHLLFLMAYYMVNLSAMQLVLFRRRIMFSLKHIIVSIEKLIKNPSIKGISNRNVFAMPPNLAWVDVNKIKPVPEGIFVEPKDGEAKQDTIKLIRQCGTNYIQVCNIITKTTEGDSIFIAILFLYYILHFLMNAHKVFIYATVIGTHNFEANMFLAIFWLIIYFMHFIVFMDPIQKSQSEVQRLQLLLTHRLKINKLDKEDINNELLLFRRVIHLYKSTYSPLGLFTLNRALIVKIIGSLVTYLVIIVTYGPERKQHH